MKEHKPTLNQIGVSILLVNTDSGDSETINQTIEKIFEAYRYKKSNFYNSNDLEESNLYKPLSFNSFGYFDKIYIFFNDSFDLTNQYLHPNSPLLKTIETDEELINQHFKFKVLTGSISSKDNCEKSLLNSTYKAMEDCLPSKKKDNKFNYAFLTRLKVNSLALFENGGKVIGDIKKKLEKNYNSLVFAEEPKGIHCVESFGFNELIIVTFWKDIKRGCDFLHKIRNLDIASICNKSNYSSEITKMNVFDSCSTNVGYLNTDFSELDSDVNLSTLISVKPGNAKKVIEHVKEYELLRTLFGWQDFEIKDLYKELQSVDEIHNFLREIKPYTESISTLVTYPYKNDEDQSKQIENLFTGIPENYRFQTNQITDLVNKLNLLNINQVVIQRVKNSILNFNKSISEPDNFPYFFFLKEFIQVNIFEVTNNFITIYKSGFTDSNGFNYVSIQEVENQIIKYVRIFEVCFNNRYLHSKELAETTEVNSSFRGGIQQYLLIYEDMFRMMHRFIFKKEKPAATLYVSSYPKTESWSFCMRMNIFQVYNPGLYLVILPHEVSIHYYTFLTEQIFAYVSSPKQQKPPLLKNLTIGSMSLEPKKQLSTRDVFKSLALISNFEKEYPWGEYLTDYYKTTIEKIKFDDKVQIFKIYLQYLLPDIVTLKTTFYKDFSLFIYWHLVYFLQLFGNRQSNNFEYVGNLRTILARFILLKYFVKTFLESDTECENKQETLDFSSESLEGIAQEIEELIETIVQIPGLNKELNKAADDIKALINHNIFNETSQFIISSSLVLTEQFLVEKETLAELEFHEEHNHFHLISKNELFKLAKTDDAKINRIFEYQRLLSFKYLSFFKEEYSEIILTDDNMLFNYSVESNDSKNQCYKNKLFINTSGSINVKGLVERQKIYTLKINYLQNVWHLSNLHKSIKHKSYTSQQAEES